MARDLFYSDSVNAGFTGRQDLIRGDGTPASVSNAPATALVMGPGTFSFPLDVAGNGSMRVVLNPSVTVTPAPTSPAVSTSTTGGTGLAAATAYFYKVTALYAGGVESGPSTEVTVTTGAGTTNSNTVSWAAMPNATGYNIYRGTATNAENVYYTVGAVTSYIDTGAASTAGTPPAAPAAATAALQPTFYDRQTIDPTVAAVPVTLTPGTPTAASMSLTGQRIILLVITVPARGQCILARAEYSAK